MATKKPALSAVADPPLSVKHAHLISAVRQKSSDVGMELASAYKTAEADGLDRPALKAAIKLRNQEPTKTRHHLETLVDYLIDFGILSEETDIVFVQTSLLDVEPAA